VKAAEEKPKKEESKPEVQEEKRKE